MNDHERFRDDLAAYLLGALPEDEARGFEAHLETCPLCQEDVQGLRTTVDALPRSVVQMEAPASLKASLMDTVRAEAGEAAPAPARRRLAGLLPTRVRMRPRVAWAMAALVLALAVAAGFGIAQLVSDEQTRTLAGQVDDRRIPGGEAELRVEDDGEDGAILRVNNFPELAPDRTYQAWVARGNEISPQPTFEVTPDGRGVVALPTDLRDVDAVLVTREPRGGSQAPTEMPLLQVEL